MSDLWTDDGWRLRQASDRALGQLMGTAPALTVALRTCRRTGERLTGLASARLGPLPEAVTPAQERMLQMDAASLAALAVSVGAVRHAPALLRVLDGTTLRDLTAAMGPAARQAALRWHHLVVDSAVRTDATPLPEQVVRDGWCAQQSWCTAQPAPVGRRVRLLLATATAVSAAEAAIGAHIVEAMVTDDA